MKAHGNLITEVVIKVVVGLASVFMQIVCPYHVVLGFKWKS